MFIVALYLDKRIMKGISYITDDTARRKAIVIDLDAIAGQEEELQELIDVLVAESRKDNELVDWQKAKEELRLQGKL